MRRTFYIAGAQFHDLAKVIKDIKVGELLNLEPEPNNKYDPNAVKILHEDVFLGYVPKKFSAEVAGHLENEIYLECIVEEVDAKAKQWEMCLVTVKTVSIEDAEKRGMLDEYRDDMPPVTEDAEEED